MLQQKFSHNFTYVALGANLPGGAGASPLQTCGHAIGAIMALEGVRNLVRSRWYSTAPVPASDQPRYINGVIRMASSLPPAVLLGRLAAIELACGRLRAAADAARTLDLDIIDMEGQIRAAPDPILPHPRAHLRAFVLLPLRDVAPSWIHPGSGVPIGALIAGTAAQDTRPL